jgi:group I intron endonuclease
MTIGIYLLKFKGTTKVYVGQSLRIEDRYTKHLYRLKNNLANYKMMKAYNMYGNPYLEILLECSAEDDLDILENEAIDIFDAVNNGLNINTKAGGGSGLSGETHPKSKYSFDIIRKVFYLINQNMSFKNISKITLVYVDTIRDISKGKAHRWLSQEFPEDYIKMLGFKGIREKNTAKDQGIIYPEIVCPNGNIYTITNLSAFAREHGLNKSHLSGVLNKKRLSHKGWKLKT